MYFTAEHAEANFWQRKGYNNQLDWKLVC